MEVLEAKGRQMSGYLISLLRIIFSEDEIDIITPEDEKSRGCQVSFILTNVETKEVICNKFRSYFCIALTGMQVGAQYHRKVFSKKNRRYRDRNTCLLKHEKHVGVRKDAII